MSSAILTCSADSHYKGSEGSPVSEGSPASDGSPLSSVCQCENQLAHWDWAGRPHPNLPERCWPARAATSLQVVSHIAVNDGKISV